MNPYLYFVVRALSIYGIFWAISRLPNPSSYIVSILLVVAWMVAKSKDAAPIK